MKPLTTLVVHHKQRQPIQTKPCGVNLEDGDILRTLIKITYTIP